MDIPRPLIYEIAYYDPLVLLVIEWLSKNHSLKVSSDESYLHTLLEEILENKTCRSLPFSECKLLLSDWYPISVNITSNNII